LISEISGIDLFWTDHLFKAVMLCILQDVLFGISFVREGAIVRSTLAIGVNFLGTVQNGEKYSPIYVKKIDHTPKPLSNNF
jgi:hypothetical protein